jgi:hypothetical protein
MTRGRRIKGARRSGSGAEAFRTPFGASSTNTPPSRAFFSTYDLGQASAPTSFSRSLWLGIDGAMGGNLESSLRERAMTAANTCGNMQRRLPVKSPAFVIAATQKAAQAVTTQA